MGLFDRLLGKDAGSNHERSCPIGFDVTDDSRVTSAATIVVMNRRLLPSLAPEDLSLIVPASNDRKERAKRRRDDISAIAKQS